MGTATKFTDWAYKPASTLSTFNRASPNLKAIWSDFDVRFPGTASLGIYGQRDQRSHAGVRSVHSWGAAGDRSYRGPGRAVGVAMIDFLIGWSLELGVQAVHDYLGSTIWRAYRPKSAGGPGWKKQPKSSSGMGQSWADWLHIEVNEDAWGDGRSVSERIGEVHQLVPTRPVVTYGSTGPAVAAAQVIMLERAGQDVGPIDGRCGPRTIAAWQNVAAWCKWPIDQDIAGDDWSLLAWIDGGWGRLEAVGVAA